MMPSSDQAFRLLQNGMLRVTSLLVPAGQRSEWHREWSAELWHVRRSLCESGPASWLTQCEITAFCRGSFQDALCLRRDIRPVAIPSPRVDGSAGQCILRLCTFLGLCIVIASLLPGVQTERDPSRFQVNSGLILVQTSPSGEDARPSIRPDLYRNWKSTRQRFFDDFAFYRTARETASLSSSHAAGWNVTHGSLNLLALLGLPIQFASSTVAEDRTIPSVILSHAIWTHDFNADPQVAGRLIRIGRHEARIAGVLPYGAWRLPGSPDAWLLEPDSEIASTRSAHLGYLIAHLNRRGQSAMLGESIPIASRDVEDDDSWLYAVSFANRLQGPWGIYQFALILALLALPAVTSVTLGESNYSSHRPSRKRTLYRWAFLAAKFLLIAAIGYYASLDLAYWNASTYSPIAECAQLACCFWICLFGFRWALSDQRQRCPVCLRRVTHPAQVGLASRTFLGWNGTEMMCMGGHTLLHVPSMPTSWFGGQRWLYLDTSWDFLFADSTAA